jgi:hypothetical protein
MGGLPSPAYARWVTHAGHELSAGGDPICPRLGLAADFTVTGIDARDLALWIVEHTPFDRLYLYEPDRPLHVSVGPEEARQIVHMARGPSGRRVPRVISAERLRER